MNIFFYSIKYKKNSLPFMFDLHLRAHKEFNWNVFIASQVMKNGTEMRANERLFIKSRMCLRALRSLLSRKNAKNYEIFSPEKHFSFLTSLYNHFSNRNISYLPLLVLKRFSNRENRHPCNVHEGMLSRYHVSGSEIN